MNSKNKFSFQQEIRNPTQRSLTQFCVRKPLIYRLESDAFSKENRKNIDSDNEKQSTAPENEISKIAENIEESPIKSDSVAENLPQSQTPNEFHDNFHNDSRSEFHSEFHNEDWDEIAAFQRSEELARLESVLFLAREPLSSRKLAQYSEISSVSRVHSLLRELSEFYLRQPCAFFLVEIAGGYQLRTRSQFAPWLVRLQEVPIEIRLSSTALETLAIIAKKQPVLRATIESIRGVQCGETLRQLLERNLIKIVGRSEELGRPFLYGTTKFFLQVFGLKKIDELFTNEM